MSNTEKNLPTKYDHMSVEEGLYQWWLEGKYFEATGDEKKQPYTIVIPPPNVTGKLHLGHAWDTTLQDILTRTKRMQGYDVLWLPGMDHAGIATQAKVEGNFVKKVFHVTILAVRNSLKRLGNGKKNTLLTFVNNGESWFRTRLFSRTFHIRRRFI